MTNSVASALAEKARSVGSLVPFLNKSFVSLYKVFGFFLLTAIVTGMFFYLCTSGFYFFNHRWIVPLILTPENDKVIQARLAYLEKSYQISSMKAELSIMQSEARHYEFVSTLQNKFQKNFIHAILWETKNQRKDLDAYQKSFHGLKASNLDKDPSLSSQTSVSKDLEQQYTSGIISRDEYIKAQGALSQLGMTRMLQKERLTGLVNRKESLEKALAQMQSKSSEELSLTKENLLNFFDLAATNLDLMIKEQPLYAAVIAQSEVDSKRAPLEKKMQDLQVVIESYNNALRKLEQSPFVRAAHGAVTVAFVPYENLQRIHPANNVYGCYLEFIFCRAVGKVEHVLSGEVTARHPLSGKELRGQLVELSLASGMEDWAQSSSLVTKRPVFL